MKKKPNLKKKLWSIFSLYIRTRDAVKTTKTTEEAICITCEVRYPLKNLHAGHFLPGRHNSVLFDERNVHAQCGVCNMWRKGNTVKYFRKMQLMYGDDVINELEKKDTETKQYKTWELKDLIETYKDKYTNLLGKTKLPF